jgi:hypothetical protein
MPKPKKVKGESTQQRVGKLIRHYIKAGYPDGHGQASAIAHSVARKEGRKVKKPKK